MKGSDMEGLLDQLSSKYAVTMAVAQRAKQLEGGARCFLEPGEQHTALTAAMEEIRRGKLDFEYREEDEDEDEEEPTVGLADIAVPPIEEELEATPEDEAEEKSDE